MVSTDDTSGLNDWAKGEFKAHRRKVFCLAFNCDGRFLATGSQDQTIRLWKGDDIASTRQEAELRGHTESVMYMRWHPTHPDKLASISQQEKNVRFWDHRNGKNSPTATLDTPGQNLYLAWTNNGNYLAVGNKDDVVSIVDVRKMKIAHKYTYKYQVNELSFAQDDSAFLQATGNGDVEVFKFPDMQKVGSFRGHTASVLSLSYDPQHKYLATGGADAISCLWDARDLICLRTFYHIDNPIRSLAFSHDSRYLAMTGEDPAVYLEDVENGKTLGDVKLRSSPEDVAWHPKHQVLVYPVEAMSGDGLQTVVEWRRAPRQ